MSNWQTWTLLEERGHIWFDDEAGDATVFLQIITDLSEPAELRWPEAEPKAPDMTLFQLMSADKYYLVAGAGFKRDIAPARLGALIANEFDGICEVLKG
jgi:hypothetical protein